ncbi:Transcription factor SPT20, partial [Branchiostoma belcheri]
MKPAVTSEDSTQPTKAPQNSDSENSVQKSLNHKLNDLFVDESEKEPENKKLRSSVHLLDKLVTKEKLTCLVVNLYPGNKGYSLMLKGKNGIDSETIKLPYEESDLLDYLDTEELPPILVDLLERSQANVFYNGCVIAEVRDFRRTANSKTYESHHVLLRPTAQTLVCDVNAITNDGEHRWTQDDKHELEKQLVLATAEPLCLDPSPVVAVVSNRIQHHRLKFSTKPLKRCAKRFSQTSANRRREMTSLPAPPHLFLHDFLQKRKEKKPHPPVDLKCVDMWKQRSLNLSAPSHVEYFIRHCHACFSPCHVHARNLSTIFNLSTAGGIAGWGNMQRRRLNRMDA